MNVFLTAEWTELLMATYEADKKILQQFLLPKTELHDWNGKYFVSVVGFMFTNHSILRLKTPFFNSFPEINLRMYVRCKLNDKWKTVYSFYETK